MTAPARALAARVLERVEDDRAFADLALEAERGRRPLDGRDAALATELVYGTLRWQRYLDWILGPHSRRRLDRLDTPVRVALRLAAYQMVFLDRVPDFAAVNDTVDWVGRRCGRWAAGYANAVLRALGRRGPAEREPRPPRDPVEALAVRVSFPTWLCARWVARWGPAEAEALMRALNERPPLTLRTNTLRTSRPALAERLAREAGLRPVPTPLAPEGLTVEGGAPGSLAAFGEGLLAVQDEGSMLIGHLLAPRPGETVADACAAPGTKATHLAALMEDRGRVLAFDPDGARLGRLAEATARLGVTVVTARAEPVEVAAPALGPVCDAVLVDAPCTNLGVLRRHPEAKWQRGPADLAAATARQRAILTVAAGLVRPGGRLVYATCSLEPEENAEVVGALLAARPDLRLDPPAAFPVAPDADGFVRLLPHRQGTDGFTAARLVRAL